MRERERRRGRDSGAEGETATGRESDVEDGAGGETCAKGGAYRERAAQRERQRRRGRELREGRRVPGESCADGGADGYRARAPPP